MGKTKTSFGLKAVQRLHQTDVAFGDNLRNRQAIAAVCHGDFGGKTQMAGDKPVRGIAVTVFAPTFGKLVLLVPFEHLETPDVVQLIFTDSISNESSFTPLGRNSLTNNSHNTLLSFI